MDGGDVKLKIITDSEKVRDVIGQDLANLKESLRDQDLNLTNVEMNSGKDEQSRHENTQRFGSEFGQNQNQNQEGQTDNSNMPDAKPAVSHDSKLLDKGRLEISSLPRYLKPKNFQFNQHIAVRV